MYISIFICFYSHGINIMYNYSVWCTQVPLLPMTDVVCKKTVSADGLAPM